MKTRQAEKSINPPSLKLRRTKKVLVFGTFDGIHPGHIFFLTEAAKLGKLTVSIASNDIVKSLKLKIPLDEKDRKNQIEKLGIASKVIIGDQKPRTWSIIKKEQPDIIAVGYDQKKFYDALKKDYKEINTPFKIVKIKSLKPHIYKSRLLHKREKICAYCTIPEIKERTILENKFAFAFPTNIPIVPGHILIVPKRCVAKFEDMTKSEKEAVFDLQSKLKIALKKSFGADGFNIAWNEGELAGQSVPHFHLHILPRKPGDEGITKYEPRKFLYRPNGNREKSPENELLEVSKLIKKHL